MSTVADAPESSTAPAPAPPSLGSLPAELFSAIVEQLSLGDFRNLRLASRHLAREARPFLSQASFAGLPWRRDMARLHGLSSTFPECGARIRDVKFVFAALDEYRAYHDSFSHMFGYEPEVRTERLVNVWTGYQESQRAVRRILSTTKQEGAVAAAPEVRTRAVATTRTLCLPFPVELVGRALAGLPNLRSLTLTWMECPWDEDVATVFDPDESVRLQKESARKVQREFVRSLWVLDVPLERLQVDGFLLTREDLAGLEAVPAERALTSLRDLKVEMANLKDENEEARGAALEMLMGKMESLV
ncbi:unnamed protein product [Clonostachys byssicola]|uniref:F-box domain-containing protein n=1 Tax=Clonostachys byssicola TaxID=160290 RepID=A0A9N9Y705_9HYPO|nr:unnamed protein product [Clonostachys byssicola]